MTGLRHPLSWARRHRRSILIFAAGGATLGVTLAAGGAIVSGFGLFPADAFTPHNPIVARIAHWTFVRSVRHHAGDEAPPRFTPEQVEAGFRQYEQDCVMCHGAPGVARAPWVTGMNPGPPYLMGAARRWTPAQMRWIVANGAKMTGMPAWRVSRSDQQIWNLVGFLEAMSHMSAADYARMRASAQASGAAPKSR